MESQDRIEIKDLVLRCIIGINDVERKDKQDVVINVVMMGNFEQAAASDDIRDAVNYRSVAKEIINAVESSKFFLLEKLAEHIAGICLQEAKVDRVQVSVQKPGALRFSRSVGISIERARRQSST